MKSKWRTCTYTALSWNKKKYHSDKLIDHLLKTTWLKADSTTAIETETPDIVKTVDANLFPKFSANVTKSSGSIKTHCF